MLRTHFGRLAVEAPVALVHQIEAGVAALLMALAAWLVTEALLLALTLRRRLA
jgi:hypothetical protein